MSALMFPLARFSRWVPAPRSRLLAAIAGLALLAAPALGLGLGTPRTVWATDAGRATGSLAAPAGPVASVLPAVPAAIRLDGRGAPGARDAAAVAATGPWNYAGRVLLAVGLLPVLFWVRRRTRGANRIDSPGFEVISPTERRHFILLEDRFQALDFLSKLETRGQLRLSANLNKVTVSVRRFGYLMEDKNYRNALLVNRRRVRRTLLRDGDVLDLGDLTLLYRDNRAAMVQRFSSVTPPEGKSQLRFGRLNGPVRRGMPMLVPELSPSRVFYITKNLVFLGRSDSNDLVIKSRNVYYRHAKLERVGGRWKIQDLSILGNTLVNNRRVEQRFLKEGDEIAIETHRFRFSFVTSAMRERPPQTDPTAAEEGDEMPSGGGPGSESGEGQDDMEEVAS